MNPLNETMRQAMRLMHTGDLRAATRALQKGLSRGMPRPTSGGEIPDVVPECAYPASAVDSAPIEGEWRVVGCTSSTDAKRDRARSSWSRDSDGDHSSDRPETAFRSHRFTGRVGTIDYKLYVPERLDPAGAPLLIMLHGCTQSPDDFARGTRMNALALEQGYVVAYPEQSVDRNPNRCWNWFRPGDQQRGEGEPALLATLTRDVITTHRLDGHRVFVAGLSAGGAMAAVLAQAYPELFTAMGVHSGLPVGAARDVTSAFTAMRKGCSPGEQDGRTKVPAIVFHGDQDRTVHPSNGSGVVSQSLGQRLSVAANADAAERFALHEGRRYTRVVYRNDDGTVGAEHWIIEGAGHAWSGGDPAGSYTDPSGPDASREMLRFFSER